MGAQRLAPTCDGGLQPYGSSSVVTFDGWPPRAGAYFPARGETLSNGRGLPPVALRCDTIETAALAEGEPTDPRPEGANISEEETMRPSRGGHGAFATARGWLPGGIAASSACRRLTIRLWLRGWRMAARSVGIVRGVLRRIDHA